MEPGYKRLLQPAVQGQSRVSWCSQICLASTFAGSNFCFKMYSAVHSSATKELPKKTWDQGYSSHSA